MKNLKIIDRGQKRLSFEPPNLVELFAILNPDLPKPVLEAIKAETANPPPVEPPSESPPGGFHLERSVVQGLEERLQRTVLGQNPAIARVVQPLKRAAFGLVNPDRPLASFIFAGSSGVGKTQLAKALAIEVFGKPDALVRFDMSEFARSENVSRLVGAPPGYVGHGDGELFAKLSKNPPCVVLLDEIEKADPSVWNMFLQILDEGRWTTGTGKTMRCTNAIFILTTNLGCSNQSNRSIGFSDSGSPPTSVSRLSSPGPAQSERRKIVNRAVEDYFRPEFIGRLDDLIVFDTLSPEILQRILSQKLKVWNRKLRQNSVQIRLTPKERQRLIELGFSPATGVRALERQIEKSLIDPICENLLNSPSRSELIVNRLLA